MATPARKRKNRNRGGFNPLAMLKDWIAMFFQMLVGIKDRVTGKTVTQKAKNLGETVQQQQEMVKEAEKAFSSEMQRAERNFDEAKRSMDAHKMALNMGPSPTASEKAKMGVEADAEQTGNKGAQPPEEEAESAPAEVEVSDNDKSEHQYAVNNDDHEKSPVNDNEQTSFNDVYMATKGPEAIRAIGGLVVNGKPLNPFNVDKWLTADKIETRFDLIKQKVSEHLIETDGSAKAVSSEQKTVLKGLLFEQLVGSLSEIRPTENSEGNRRQLTTALAYLWHEATQVADGLIETVQKEGTPEERDQRVMERHEEAFSPGMTKKRLEALGAFVEANSGVAIESDDLDETPGDAFYRASVDKWLASAKNRYDEDLENGHLTLEEIEVKDPKGKTTVYQSTKTQVTPPYADSNAEIADAEYEVPGDVNVSESGAAAAPHQETSVDPETPRKHSHDEADSQEFPGDPQFADEEPFGKGRKKAEQGGYTPSMQEQTIQEVSDQLPRDEVPGSKTEQDSVAAETTVKKGPTYADVKSVPINDGGLSF